MTILQALVLSVVEGITEFLPISSTGHLILAGNLLQIVQADFVKSFEIAIQLGAILSVVGLYWRKLWDSRILAGFAPTAIVGFVAYPFIKSQLLGNTNVVLWSLFLGGLVLLFIDKLAPKRSSLNIRSAFIIGLFQSISVIPGVSRAAATIVGGLMVGLDRKPAVEFSFLLAVPTMLGATGLDLVKSSWVFTSYEWLILLAGFTASALTAWLAIRFLLSFVKTHTFFWFGIYRIALTLLWWAVFV